MMILFAILVAGGLTIILVVSDIYMVAKAKRKYKLSQEYFRKSVEFYNRTKFY